MPWKSNNDLPESVRGSLPEAAQTRFRTVANGALGRGDDEESAIKQAWSVVRRAWKRAESGEWVRKTADEVLKTFSKAAPRTLYISRKVLNAQDILDWAKEQGFPNTEPAEKLHTTIAYSRRPVDWMKISPSYTYSSGEEDRGQGNLLVPAGGPRLVEFLGPKKAAVLLFGSDELRYRHNSIHDPSWLTVAGTQRDVPSWDWPDYQPHITISYDAAGLDLDTIDPYQGPIKLGPEVFETLDETPKPSSGGVEVSVLKVDKSLGLVFGWAIICKRDGEDYYDLNIDPDTLERVPEHIPEETMLKSAADFMQDYRLGKEMHEGASRGEYVFAFPLTTEIAKAMGIQSRMTGLMVAFKPDPAMLEKFASGELTGFSIGGKRLGAREFEA